MPQGGISGISPDDWYRGAVAFRDNIVEIDIAAGRAATLAGSEAALDITMPVISPDGTYLFFVDKHDGTLWRMTLVE